MSDALSRLFQIIRVSVPSHDVDMPGYIPANLNIGTLAVADSLQRLLHKQLRLARCIF